MGLAALFPWGKSWPIKPQPLQSVFFDSVKSEFLTGLAALFPWGKSWPIKPQPFQGGFCF